MRLHVSQDTSPDVEQPKLYWGSFAQSLVFCVVFFPTIVCSFSFDHCIVCFLLKLRLLITPLVSFGHCIVCPATYHF